MALSIDSTANFPRKYKLALGSPRVFIIVPIVPIRTSSPVVRQTHSWEQIYSNALSRYLIRYGRPMIKGCNGIAITLAVLAASE